MDGCVDFLVQKRNSKTLLILLHDDTSQVEIHKKEVNDAQHTHKF